MESNFDSGEYQQVLNSGYNLRRSEDEYEAIDDLRQQPFQPRPPAPPSTGMRPNSDELYLQANST